MPTTNPASQERLGSYLCSLSPQPWRVCPLDWRVVEDATEIVVADIRSGKDDAAYIVRAVNAYPRLMEVLLAIAFGRPEDAEWNVQKASKALLRELGEL